MSAPSDQQQPERQQQSAARRAARRAAVRRPTAAIDEDSDGDDEKRSASPGAAAASSMQLDREDDDAHVEEVETPAVRLQRQSAARGHPSVESLGGMSAATHAVQSAAQLVAIGLPRGLQFGVDYWAFVVGEKFKGMKMIPPGVHYFWFRSTERPAPQPTVLFCSVLAARARTTPRNLLLTLDLSLCCLLVSSFCSCALSLFLPFSAPLRSSVHNGGDMAPRVGFFAWLEAGDVLVRQWDPMLESLTQCADADEEERYVLGARRFDFDAGQGTYPLHVAQSKWGPLVSHIDRALVARLEPIGKMISSFEVRKYKLEDKFAKQAEVAGAEGKKREGDEEMSDVSRPASSAAESSAAAAAAAASGSSAAAAPSPSDSASASAPADAKSSSSTSKFTAAPSTSFYSRVPTPAALVAASGIPKSDTAARAALLSSLHMDQTPLLESLLSTHFAPAAAAAAAAAAGVATGDDADPCLGLLGELQFAFIAFLIGQDAEGFEAWKALTTLLCSCVTALQTRHALYERWVAVFAAQLAELPRDFFIDVLSGENFLGPSLQRLFDAAVEPDLAIPASLSYALRELAEMVRRHFHAAPPKHPLPGFRSADPATVALQAAAAAAAAAAPGPEAATAVEEKEAKQKAGADPHLTDEQRRAAEARQRRELLQRLQAEADEDEYAPTVADEDM